MEWQRPRKFRRQTRAGRTERPQGQGPRLLSTRNSSPSLTARALEDPAPPYPVEERPTLRVLKSSQKSGSTRPLSGSTRPAERLADESALRFIKKDQWIKHFGHFFKPMARRQGVTLWRLPVTLAHNCCKLQLQAQERHSS